MTNMNIGKEEAREILSAISVARGEMGVGFETLEKKILTSFPEIVKERMDYNEKIEAICKEQHARRKSVVDRYNSEVEHPTVGNVVEWYIKNEKFIRENYSDEICFAGDLFEQTPRPKINELIVSLRASKGRNSFETQALREDKDSELWHNLIRFLEDATYKERVKRMKK